MVINNYFGSAFGHCSRPVWGGCYYNKAEQESWGSVLWLWLLVGSAAPTLDRFRSSTTLLTSSSLAPHSARESTYPGGGGDSCGIYINLISKQKKHIFVNSYYGWHVISAINRRRHYHFRSNFCLARCVVESLDGMDCIVWQYCVCVTVTFLRVDFGLPPYDHVPLFKKLPVTSNKVIVTPAYGISFPSRWINKQWIGSRFLCSFI